MTPSQKSLAEQITEIDQEINLLEQQILRLEDRADLLANQPRGTDLEQADIARDVASNQARIKELQDRKAALGMGGSPGSAGL